MIVIDTNVVSEFMSSAPAESAREWLNWQDAGHLFLPAIAIAEIGFGLRVLPEGRRRRLLSERFEQFVALAFDTRILPFGTDAARIYGEIRAHRQSMGRPMSNFDAQIAAIARSKGFAVATRNDKDFEHCGIDVINPFDGQ